MRLLTYTPLLVSALLCCAAPVAKAQADEGQDAALPVAKVEAALPKQKFFSLGKARVYRGGIASRPALPSAGRANMAVVGDGKYFPLPKGRAASNSFIPSSMKNLASGETKSLPQSQAKHILSLFSPEELD